jgi:hypothetical protein
VPFQEILFEPPANGQRRAPPLIDEDAVVILPELEEVIMFLSVGPDHSGIAAWLAVETAIVLARLFSAGTSNSSMRGRTSAR